MSKTASKKSPKKGTQAKKSASQKAVPKKKTAKKGASPAKKKRSLLGRFLYWSLVASIWIVVALGAVTAYYAYDLPDVGKIAEDQRRPSIKLLSSSGEALVSYGGLYGDIVYLNQLPKHVPQAVLAIEDRRFYSHPGLDPIGLLRAIVTNLRTGQLRQGGSTLTQQLAKNLFLKPDRTIRRKVQELLLAFWLENKLTKDQILTLYLNKVYFGGGAHGIDAAAQRFFGKAASDLGLYESALLAGALKAPSRLNPGSGGAAADARAAVVLLAMADVGFISDAAAAEAVDLKRTARPQQADGARYFGDWVLEDVEGYLGRLDRDVLVETTLETRAQEIAEEEVARLLAEEGSERRVSQAAVVLLGMDGAVRAMVGGGSYGKSQFNRAIQAQRQPGSGFKLFVYLTALEAGYHPDSRLIDEPVSIATPQGAWRPKNFGQKYYGEVTLRDAYARSLNSVAAKLIDELGPPKVLDMARRLGISSDLQATPSLALGSYETTLLEMASAYTTLANGGFAVQPYALQEVRSRNGQVLYQANRQAMGRVLDPALVWGGTELSRANILSGTGRAADPGRPAGGKTATTQDYRDAWYIGFTADYTLAVWLGNDNNSPMDEVTGGSLPAHLFQRIMTRVSEDKAVHPLPGMELPPIPYGTVPQVVRETPQPGQEGGGNFLERLLDRFSDDSASPRTGQQSLERDERGK